MRLFDDLAAAKGTGTVYDDLVPVRASISPHEFEAPADYQSFLREIGYGALRHANLALYGGLIWPQDVYGQRPDLPDAMMLFGDDFAGYNVGFFDADPAVYEIEPGTLRVERIADSFSTFIREKILEVGDNE
jgi:hypothetical protein